MATLNKHLFLSHARITWVYVGYKVPARAGMLAFFLSFLSQNAAAPTAHAWLSCAQTFTGVCANVRVMAAESAIFIGSWACRAP